MEAPGVLREDPLSERKSVENPVCHSFASRLVPAEWDYDISLTTLP